MSVTNLFYQPERHTFTSRDYQQDAVVKPKFDIAAYIEQRNKVISLLFYGGGEIK